MRIATRWTLAAVLVAALSFASSAGAQPVGPGGKKELAGKKGFTLDRFEQTLFDKQAQKIQARMSQLRKKKIGSLEQIINSNRPYKNKADVLFRLAEAYWDEAVYQYLLARDTYDRQYECWEEKRPGCEQEPPEPKQDFSISLKYYREVLQQFPSYRRIDEVMYYLGRAALQAGKSKNDVQLQKEGVRYLNRLVQQHPKSRFIAKTHLLLGEHHFETDSLFYAKQNYEKIINNFKRSSMFNYALYKLGWVYFNLTEFDKTIETFKQVVANVGGGKARAVIEFREQALNDLVVTWAEVDGGWQAARKYFLTVMDAAKVYKKLDKMASLLVSKDKDMEAIDLYKHLIEHDRVAKKVVEYYDAILEVRRKIGDMNDIEKEINLLTTALDAKGAWYLANKSDDETTSRANDLVSSNLFFMANHYHRGAQKAEKERRKALAVDGYKSAAHYYKMFLDRFPDHKQSYKLNFFYAEILYDQIKDYGKAAEQYEAVLEKDRKGEYVEDAALGVIYSIQQLMCEKGLGEDCGGESVQYVKKGQEEDKDKDKTDLKSKASEKIPETPLHPLESRFVNAADTYVNVLREALKDPAFRKKYPDRGKMIPNIMFIAARTFYRHAKFREAVTRLMVIFELYPDHKMANIAVNTIIDAYAQLKRWERIEEWARKLIKTKNFKVKKKSELEKIIAIAKTEHARDLTKQRKFDEAIRVQEEIVAEFGRKNKGLASKALYNIGVIHEEARRFPEAVRAYEEVIKRYKKEDVAQRAQFDIGVLYENQTKFTEAAEAFIEMKKFKGKSPDGCKLLPPTAKAYRPDLWNQYKDQVPIRRCVSDALRNAALIYEALEKYEAANDTFQLYVKNFGKKYFKHWSDEQYVAFFGAKIMSRSNNPDELVDAAKTFEKIARTYGKKDDQYKLRALAEAGTAYRKADEILNEAEKKKWKEAGKALEEFKRIKKYRKKALGHFKAVAKLWRELSKVPKGATEPAAKIEPSTRAYAGLGEMERAEYVFNDYDDLRLIATNDRGRFSIRILKQTLKAKAEALMETQKAYDKVLEFKDPGMAARAAFRIGYLYYSFAESLFNAPIPPGFTEEQKDEYRYQLEEFAAPIQEKALAAFTEALKAALGKNVYNKWSRRSAIYAAKVNPDEFPISDFNLSPNKTKDTVQSTSFIRQVRRGDTVVDFAKKKKGKKKPTDKPAAPKTGEAK